MTADAAAFTATWRVGHRSVQLTAPRPKPGQALSAVIEWTSSLPDQMTPTEWKQYLAGRNAAVAELAQALGIVVAVVDT